MTTFAPTTALQPAVLAPSVVSSVSREAREAITDSRIREGRASVSPADVEARQTPRASIAELNAMSWEEISDRFHKSRIDRRPTAVKVLDLIDAPRNRILNWAAPGIAARRREEGDIAAFGLPRVMFSDVLEELGVENRVVRGLAGFVGDVALDPLTYLGPAGFGARFASKAGRPVVELTAEGNRALGRAARDAASGRATSGGVDRAWRDVIDLSFRPEVVQRMRQQGMNERAIEAAINNRLRGSLRESGQFRKVGRGIGALIGGEPTRRGGLIAERFWGPAPSMKAAAEAFEQGQLLRPGRVLESGEVIQGSLRAAQLRGQQTELIRRAIDEAGRATLPIGVSRRGVRLASEARGVSEVLHFPFTGISVQIPAFTRMGRDRGAIRAITGASDSARAASALASVSLPVYNRLQDLTNEASTLFFEEQRRSEDLIRRSRQLDEIVAAGPEPSPFVTMQRQRADDSLRRAEAMGDPELVNLARQEMQVAESVFERQRTEFASARQLEFEQETRALRVARQEAVARSERILHEVNETMRLDPSIVNSPTAILELAAHRDALIATNRILRAKVNHDPAVLENARIIRRARRVDGDELTPLTPERAEELQAAKNIEVDEALARIVDLSDEEFRALEAQVDLARTRILASEKLADAAGGSLVQTLSADDQALVRVAEAAVGLTGGNLGESLLVGMVEAAGLKAGRHAVFEMAYRMDEIAMRKFGRRTGHLRRAMNVIRRMDDNMAANAQNNVLKETVKRADELAKLMNTGRDDALQLGMAWWYRHLQRVGVGDDDVRFFTSASIGTDGKPRHNAFSVIDDAQKKGLLPDNLDDSNNPIVRALDDLAADASFLVRDLGDLAMADGFLETLMQAYVPNIPTRQASQALRRQKLNPHFEARGEPLSPRTTWQTRFVRDDGSEFAFFEFERAYGVREVERLRRTGAEEQARRMEETIDAIREFDALPQDDPRVIGTNPTDAFELNALVAEGRFQPLTGGQELPYGFFDTNLATVLAARTGMHQRQLAKRAFAELANSSPAFSVSDQQTLRQAGDGSFRLDNGATVESYIDGRNRAFARIGGHRFRHVDQTVLDSPMGKFLDEDTIKNNIFEESAADMIESFAERLRNEDSASELLNVVDQLTNHWKAVTLMHPSWTMTEMIGNSMLALQAGARPDLFVKNMKHAINASVNQRNPDKLRRMRVTLGDRGEVDMAGLWNDALVNGIREASRPDEITTIMFGRRALDVPRGGTSGDRHLQSILDWTEAKRKDRFTAKGIAGQAAAANDTVMRRIYRPWFAANKLHNDAIRIGAYMTFLEMGDDATTAADKVLRGMYDYGSLTQFESTQLKRIFLPFYSWIRLNGVHQIHQLFENPKFAAALPKLQAAVEETIGGEGAVPLHHRPQWMKAMLAIQIGQNPEAPWSLLGRNVLPPGDVMELLTPIMGLEGAQNFMGYFAGSANPVLKTPLEVATKTNFFTGQSIGPSGADADLSIPEHVLSTAIRPFKEFGVPNISGSGRVFDGPVPRAFRDLGPVGGVGRMLAGGRFQSMDEQRIRRQVLNEFKELEEQYRRANARAIARERHDESLEARIQLLRVYDQMRESGFEEEIPQWARKQLDLLPLQE